MTVDENDGVLVPAVVWHPGTSAQGPSTATLAASGGHGGRHGGGGAVGAFGQQAEPPLPPPAPLVDSVGDIAGLRPRRRRRDGGEVPGADATLLRAAGVPAQDVQDAATAATCTWPPFSTRPPAC
ncbi:hypothetical protein [[Actinomadura] parvosata]|uniref:hypothetical protein n=1 Tax=[Actinomadura] parvosata TaxID=1955412 RepID=UPI0012BD667C|nr:hypothetical protein [Nonomuraea sp. ATCC 55076]